MITTTSPEKLVQTLSEVEVVLLPRSDYESLLRQSRARFTVVVEQDEEEGGSTVTCHLPSTAGLHQRGRNA